MAPKARKCARGTAAGKPCRQPTRNADGDCGRHGPPTAAAAASAGRGNAKRRGPKCINIIQAADLREGDEFAVGAGDGSGVTVVSAKRRAGGGRRVELSDGNVIDVPAGHVELVVVIR